jgi:hypothetical protein
VFGPRVAYRDQLIPETHTLLIAQVAVASPERTLTDLVRDAHIGVAPAEAVDAMIAWRPALIGETLRWLDDAPPMHFKRVVQAALRARRQDEVTR